MNKKNLLLICLLVVPFSVFSQWGIKGGIDYGTITNMEYANYRFGFHVGGTYDVQLSDKFYFQPALLFSMDNFGFESNQLVLNGTVDRYLLEVPANISYRPSITKKMKFIFDLGVYSKYGLFGDKEYRLADNTIHKDSSYDAYNRLDIGLNLGTGIDIGRIYAGLDYQYSLTNAEKGISDFHHSLFRISLGYKF
jgi:hypothetical protein